MDKTDRITIHDGRGGIVSMNAPRGGGQVQVDFHGPVVCLKAVDHYGNVKDQVCVPIPQPQAAPPAGGNGNGSNGAGSGWSSP